jgi:hypothetical protein
VGVGVALGPTAAPGAEASAEPEPTAMPVSTDPVARSAKTTPRAENSQAFGCFAMSAKMPPRVPGGAPAADASGAAEVASNCVGCSGGGDGEKSAVPQEGRSTVAGASVAGGTADGGSAGDSAAGGTAAVTGSWPDCSSSRASRLVSGTGEGEAGADGTAAGGTAAGTVGGCAGAALGGSIGGCGSCGSFGSLTHP